MARSKTKIRSAHLVVTAMANKRVKNDAQKNARGLPKNFKELLCSETIQHSYLIRFFLQEADPALNGYQSTESLQWADGVLLEK